MLTKNLELRDMPAQLRNWNCLWGSRDDFFLLHDKQQAKFILDANRDSSITEEGVCLLHSSFSGFIAIPRILLLFILHII